VINDKIIEYEQNFGGITVDKRPEIERVAYEFYQRDGCLHGRDFDHWLQAEKSVHSKEATVAAAKSSVSKKATASGPAKKNVAAKRTKTVDEGETVGNMKIKAKSAKPSSRLKEKPL
jgi:hypothetical protein